MNAVLSINKLQLRNDLASKWSNKNPVLAKGEMGVEVDTYKFKIGDGNHSWNSLPYAGVKYAPISHTHDDRYYTETEITNLLKSYSLTSHNHNGVYQPVGSYANTNHNHDNVYAKISHTHSEYQPKGSYAAVSHTHTSSQVTGLSTVAKTGSYNDLNNKPTIPTNVVSKDYVDSKTGLNGLPVGYITYQPVLLPNFLKLNGAAVNAKIYPELLKFAQDNKLIHTTGDILPHQFNYDAPYLALPDFTNRVIQSSETYGSVEAGLPNITGSATLYVGSFNNTTPVLKNALANTGIGRGSSILGGGPDDGFPFLEFNASMSNPIYGKSRTVQPEAITLIAQIKYR